MQYSFKVDLKWNATIFILFYNHPIIEQMGVFRAESEENKPPLLLQIYISIINYLNWCNLV